MLLVSVKANAQYDSTYLDRSNIFYYKDSTWMEERTDTIKAEWVLVANERGFVRKLWRKEVVYTYTIIRHSSGWISFNEKRLWERYFINGKLVDIIAYKRLDGWVWFDSK